MLLFLAMSMCFLSATNGSIEISGIVIDEFGDPIPGVAVHVEGTSTATVTNLDGFFSLKGLDENQTIVFTMIGFEIIRIKLKSLNGHYTGLVIRMVPRP